MKDGAEAMDVYEQDPLKSCTDQVVGSDDVAASDNLGVSNGTPG